MKSYTGIRTLIWIASLCGAITAFAQSTLPQPVLTTIYPCAVQAGTTTTVTITGSDLDGASRLHFSAKGIACTPGPKANTFSLTIDKDAQVGYCDARVIAKYGISNPRGFAITKLPVVEIKDKAMQAKTGTVLMGKAVKQDRILITFAAKKGELLRLLCQPLLLDSRMDVVCTIRDSASGMKGRMDANGALDFAAAADGSYTIELQDLMFRGDAEYPFVLALAKPNTSGLDVDTALKPTEKFEADLSKPTMLKSTYAGWFPARGRPRYFTFSAKKGDVRIIEVKSARLGFDTDPSFIVEKMDGEKATFIAEASDRPTLAAKDEFDAGWTDPSLRFEAKEDGEYRIKLRNQFQTRAPFEISAQPPGVGFELVAIASEVPAAKKTAVAIAASPLWRGGVATFKVVASRERGFTGPISLSAEGVPSGVKCEGGMISAGRDVGFISFSADDKAEGWGGAVRIVGMSGDVSKTARGATVVRVTPNTAKDPIFTRFTRETVLGVVAAEAPLSIEAEAPLYEVTTTGKLDVPLKITRRAGFTDAFKLTGFGLVADGPPTIDVPAKAGKAALAREMSKLKLAPGDYSVVLQTSAKFKLPGDNAKAKPKEVTATVHSKPFTIRVIQEAKK